MKAVNQNISNSPAKTTPMISYQVAMSQPESHLYEVRLRVKDWQASVMDLKMPVWTPGSYLVREYAKNLQDFTVLDIEERSLPWSKKSKNHWQIDTTGITDITVHYRIFANELSVRTNHLDQTHAYFNGAATFLYVVGFETSPIQVTIIPPESTWRISTALPPLPEFRHTFIAADFDTLVDSPFEIGTHESHYFEVLGFPHELAIWGKGNFQGRTAIADIEKIIKVEAELFGGLPYENYLFLLHLTSDGYGGLEHKNSCSLIYQRFGFRAKDKYNQFMQLLAHEFFHLWNVRRIRPQALEVFDYDQENYTSCLWFCEGTTSYYDVILPLRAGIYDAKTCLETLSKDINRFLNTPGRLVQPLSESSWDAWIKLYRRDANSDNSQISYYLKGQMVSLLLDLLIREQHNNLRSLDNVMQIMWQKFGIPEVGYTPEQLQNVIESVANVNLEDFWQICLHSTEELPLNQYLKPFGLKIQANGNSEAIPFLGLTAKTEHGNTIVKFVETGSPAQKAGIDPGDELLAIEGIRVNAEQLPERLKDYQPGDSISVSLFHQDQLRTVSVILGEPRPNSYKLVPVKSPTIQQSNNFQGWLGVPLQTVFAVDS
jgi:predicted metalloprotease with PDZ domain